MTSRLATEPSREGIIPVTRQVLTPPNLRKPRGFEYGLKTTGGRRVDLTGVASEAVITEHVDDMPSQMDAALSSMLEVLEVSGGKPHDIVSFTMLTSNVGIYRDRDVLRSLRGVWEQHFGSTYFPTKLIEQSPELMALGKQIPLIRIAGTALVNAPTDQSEGTIIWLAGQNGFDEEGILDGDIIHQTRHTMRGLESVLREGGASFETAKSVCLRMFTNLDLVVQNNQTLLDVVSEVAGEHNARNLQVYSATGFFESAAIMEMDGYVEV